MNKHTGLTVKEAAAYCGVGLMTIRRALWAGDLEHGRTSDGPRAHYRISTRQLDEWMDGNTQ